MIQELLGDNNIGIIKSDQKPKLPNTSPTSSSAAGAAAAAPENLRCPRCDSPNTKFCYYNNYNLTQPRHFCKTCRRYWTKGGALRNVPIGGGCRKNKAAATISSAGKSPSGKLKTVTSEFIKMGLFSGFEHAPDPALLWAPSQNNYNFLSLLRANQNPSSYLTNNNNNNNIANSISMKEEGNSNFLFGSSSFISRVTGPDSIDPARIPTSGLPGSFYGESHSNGLNELYQRLRSPSTSCYYNQSAPLILGNIASANSSAGISGILESAPVGTGELGFWNGSLSSWPADGAYPLSQFQDS